MIVDEHGSSLKSHIWKYVKRIQNQELYVCVLCYNKNGIVKVGKYTHGALASHVRKTQKNEQDERAKASIRSRFCKVGVEAYQKLVETKNEADSVGNETKKTRVESNLSRFSKMMRLKNQGVENPDYVKFLISKWLIES